LRHISIGKREIANKSQIGAGAGMAPDD